VLYSFFVSLYKTRLGWGGPCCVSHQRTSGLDFGSPSFITLATIIMYYLAPNFVPFGQNFINPIEVLVLSVCVCVCVLVGLLVCVC